MARTRALCLTTALVVVGACATNDAEVAVSLPQQLALSQLPAVSVERLRAVASIPGVLGPSEMLVDVDANVARGTFALPNENVDNVVLTIEFLTAQAADSDEVLIARVQRDMNIQSGSDNRVRFREEDVQTSGDPIFDVNRNGISNIEDLINGVDPAPGDIPVDISPKTISFESGVEVGGFTRSFFVMENTSAESVSVDLDIRLAPGVTIVPLSRLFENGGATASPQESTVLAPGEEQVFAVTFAPANPLFLVGSLSVGTHMLNSNVSHGALLRLLGNPEGAIPQPPADYQIQLPPAGTTIGNYLGQLEAYPADRLFSRAPKLTGVTEQDVGDVLGVDVDFAYIVSVLPRHRFSVTLDGLADDVDLHLIELDDAFVPVGTEPVVSSVGAGSSAESAEFDATNRRESSVNLLIAFDRATSGPAAEVPGAQTQEDGGSTQTAMFSVPEFLLPCSDDVPAPCDPISSDLECPDSYGEALACGRSEGNAQFVLRGRNFQSGVSVVLAGQSAICAEPILGDDFDELRCLAPPASRDPTRFPNATVVLTNPDGQVATLAEGFTYLPPLPAVLAITPTSGPTTGGLTTTVRGLNFFSKDGTAPGVLVNGVAAAEVEFVDPGQLRVILPACSTCTGGDEVDVEVVNPDGQSGTLFNGFTYQLPAGPAPTVASVMPTTGLAAGGTTVTLTGTGFQNGAIVRFDGTIASAINVTSDTVITASTPPGTPGPAEIEVINPDGQTGRLLDTAMDAYRYVVPPPTISVPIPAMGPEVGGNAILISGTNFQTGAQVLFGPNAGTNVVVNSSSTMTATVPAGTGVVDITVTNLDGQSATRSAAYTYEPPAGPPPTISMVSPNSGTVDGGAQVTFTGTGFQSGAQVFFGATTAPTVAVTSGTMLQATSPARAEGTVDVTVRNPDGQTGTLPAAYSFLVPDPTIAALLPNNGPEAGGTVVFIQGSAFQPGANVLFGAVPASQSVFNSASSITATAPPGVGSVGLTIINPDGKSATLSSAFTYQAPQPPMISDAFPGQGPTTGGTVVFITGTNFEPGATVLFGGLAAAQTAVNSASSITATTPPGLAGAVDIRVVNPNAQEDILGGGFTYEAVSAPPPVVSSVSPGSGPAEGLTSVSITGDNFEAGSRVFFGNSEAQVQAGSSSPPTQLQALSPPGAAGQTVAVRVLNTDGQSDTLDFAFGYTSEPPPLSVTSVVPGRVDAYQQQSGFVVGQSFEAGARVTITEQGTGWSQDGFNTLVVDDNLISVTFPPYGGPGQVREATVDVTVTNLDGASFTLPNSLTYEEVSDCDPMAPQDCGATFSCECNGPQCTCVQPCMPFDIQPCPDFNQEGFPLSCECTGGSCICDAVCQFQIDGAPCRCGGTCQQGVCTGGQDSCSYGEFCTGPDGCTDSCGGCGANQACLQGVCTQTCNSNGVRDPNEQCDGIDLGSVGYCIELGFIGGTLSCDSNCRWDVTGCIPTSNCGNGTAEAGEFCDPADPMGMGGGGAGSMFCDSVSGSASYSYGVVECGPNCRLDVEHCGPQPLCGNGMLDPGEPCDGTQFFGMVENCSSNGLPGTQVTCTSTCELDFANCDQSMLCNDGRIDVANTMDLGVIPIEECDNTTFVADCRELGFAGGTPTCSSCKIDTTSCTAPAAHCTSGTLNGDETDVDCGGSCAPCAAGQSCIGDPDCLSNSCNGNICSPETCSDGVMNGGETDVDCGGSFLGFACPACPNTASCVFDFDCQSGNCQDGTCSDGGVGGGGTPGSFCMMDGDCNSNSCRDGVCCDTTCSNTCESCNNFVTGQPSGQCAMTLAGVPDSACGGGMACDGAGACTQELSTLGTACASPLECLSGNCQGGVCCDLPCMGSCESCDGTINTLGPGVCSPVRPGVQVTGSCDGASSCDGDGACATNHCTNKIQDSDETGFDCGGATCAGCPGDACAMPGDCQTGLCPGPTTCGAACSNVVRDGFETDVDCGGADCGATCMIGQHCNAAADCISNNCQGGRCAQATCDNDNTREFDEDCDGTDLGGKSCLTFGYADGTLLCDVNCNFEFSRCVGRDEFCENGIIDAGENCDGMDGFIIGGCDLFGFMPSGNVTCQQCRFDFSACTPEVSWCGDGILDPGEECDGGVFRNAPDCRLYGFLLDPGVAGCDPATCQLDLSACSSAPGSCGDMLLQPWEECDSQNVRGRTCRDFGFLESDPVNCNASCEFDTTPCSATPLSTCFDGMATAGETDLDCGGPNCPPCPDGAMCTGDPDCISGHCGGSSTCESPTCSDGRKNGGETGVDCGGNTACARCMDPTTCIYDGDCTTFICVDGACQQF